MARHTKRWLRPLGAKAASPAAVSDYLILDLFETPVGYGALDGTSIVPGPGRRRRSTDGEQKAGIAARGALKILGGKASPAYGNPGVYWTSEQDGPTTFAAGTLFELHVFYDSINSHYIGIAAATSGNVTNPSMLVGSGTCSVRTETNASIQWDLPATGQSRAWAMMALPSRSLFGRLEDADTLQVGWVHPVPLPASGYPALPNYSAALTGSKAAVRRLAHPAWQDDWGVATSRIAAPVSGDGIRAEVNSLVEVTWTLGGSGETGQQLTISFRRVNDDFLWRLVCDQDSSTMRLYEVKGGIATQQSTDKTQAFAAGQTYRILLMADAASIYTHAGYTRQHAPANMPTYVGGTAATVTVVGNGTLANLAAHPRRIKLSRPQGDPVVTLHTPATYQVCQRNPATGLGSIPIEGSFLTGLGTGPRDVDARFDGGEWQTIATARNGHFSGALSGQPTGTGQLEVRVAGYGITGARSPVSVGDVFGVGGQSNADGYLDNLQSYVHAILRAGCYHRCYRWVELLDPISRAVAMDGQDQAYYDNLSGAAAYGYGSVWVILATLLMAATGVPVGFIPCAISGTAITQWQPAGDPWQRNTLLGSMMTHCTHAVAGCGQSVRGILWWQGEADSQAGMNQATYYGWLSAMCAQLATSLPGVSLMPCKFLDCRGWSHDNHLPIWAAIEQAWGALPNVRTGPNFSGRLSDDAAHAKTDETGLWCAQGWRDAMLTAFYS